MLMETIDRPDTGETIEYRDIRPEDHGTLSYLMRRAIMFGCRDAYGADRVSAWTSPKNTTFRFDVPTHGLVAEVNGMVAGFCGWRLEDDDENTARLSALYIEPTFMKRGIASDLMRRVEAMIDFAGFPRIVLYATRNAVPIYRHLGYANMKWEEVAISAEKKAPVLKMEKWLKGSGMGENIIIRRVENDDAEGLIALIGACFDEYADLGCVLDLDDLDKDLLAIRDHIDAVGGEMWVALDGGEVIGCVGYGPHEKDGKSHVELKRLYVNSAFRRNGLATRLFELIEKAAADLGVDAIDLWSDTRFDKAHAFYERHGFSQDKETRELNDPSNTTEYRFVRGR